MELGFNTNPFNPLASEYPRSVKIGELINNYLSLKKALFNDNSVEASRAGASLDASFKNFNKNVLTADQKKIFEDITDDASENAEPISKSSGNIAHQREHFALLSQDMYD